MLENILNIKFSRTIFVIPNPGPVERDTTVGVNPDFGDEPKHVNHESNDCFKTRQPLVNPLTQGFGSCFWTNTDPGLCNSN